MTLLKVLGISYNFVTDRLLKHAAARPVSYTPKYSHISPLLFRLQWLSVRLRINFKITLTLALNVYTYLSSLLTVREYSSYNLRSSDGIVLVDPCIRTKKTMGETAFSAAASKAWYNLPLHIKNEKSFNTSRKLLKNYYFKIAYHLVT